MAGKTFNQNNYGGTNYQADTINFGRPKFEMNEATIARILAEIGPPRKLMVEWIGSTRSHHASEVLIPRLQAVGFEVIRGGGIGIRIPPLTAPLELSGDGSTLSINADL